LSVASAGTSGPVRTRSGETADVGSYRGGLLWERCQVTMLMLIEDDVRILRSLETAFSARGFRVLTASTGLYGLRSVVDHRPAAVVLDLGLPDIDGFELVKMIRAVSEVPIVAATARDEEAGIVRTLDAGADDYVIKPFSADHLEARLRAVFRRTGRREAPVLVVGDLRIDTSARVARLGDEPLDLTRKEFDLLAFLASQPGHVVSKREILAAVWDQPLGGADKTVDVHLSWLRRKLGESATEPRYVHVLRGAGVKLVDPRG
jgi:two-component system, OmpR family, KDP operon response regulator KdpE